MYLNNIDHLFLPLKPNRIKQNSVEKLVLIQEGSIKPIQYKNQLCIDSYFSNMKVHQTHEHIFPKFISSLTWHPHFHNVLLAGSRGGDISLVKLHSSSINIIWPGKGRGGTITDIKFDGFDHKWFYTSSICGKIIKRRIDATEEIILKNCDDENYEVRFGCLDVNINRKIAISGDSKGFIHLMKACQDKRNDSTGFNAQIHLSNILHCEFNPCNKDIFVTCSIDGNAKVWDLRMFGRHNIKPLVVLTHRDPLNCATFSPCGGETLLINNYFDQLTSYSTPDWRIENTFKHSHNQYHRFSIIKAKWHPSCKLILIGSSTSDINEVQTVDVIDLKKKKIIANLTDGKLGVMPINDFNCTGDLIASARGHNLVIFHSHL